MSTNPESLIESIDRLTIAPHGGLEFTVRLKPSSAEPGPTRHEPQAEEVEAVPPSETASGSDLQPASAKPEPPTEAVHSIEPASAPPASTEVIPTAAPPESAEVAATPETAEDWAELIKTKGKGFISGKFINDWLPSFPGDMTTFDPGETVKKGARPNISSKYTVDFSSQGLFGLETPSYHRAVGFGPSGDLWNAAEQFNYLIVSAPFSSETRVGKYLKIPEHEIWCEVSYLMFGKAGTTPDSRGHDVPFRLCLYLPSDTTNNLLQQAKETPELTEHLFQTLYPGLVDPQRLQRVETTGIKIYQLESNDEMSIDIAHQIAQITPLPYSRPTRDSRKKPVEQAPETPFTAPTQTEAPPSLSQASPGPEKSDTPSLVKEGDRGSSQEFNLASALEQARNTGELDIPAAHLQEAFGPALDQISPTVKPQGFSLDFNEHLPLLTFFYPEASVICYFPTTEEQQGKWGLARHATILSPDKESDQPIPAIVDYLKKQTGLDVDRFSFGSEDQPGLEVHFKQSEAIPGTTGNEPAVRSDLTPPVKAPASTGQGPTLETTPPESPIRGRKEGTTTPPEPEEDGDIVPDASRVETPAAHPQALSGTEELASPHIETPPPKDWSQIGQVKKYVSENLQVHRQVDIPNRALDWLLSMVKEQSFVTENEQKITIKGMASIRGDEGYDISTVLHIHDMGKVRFRVLLRLSDQNHLEVTGIDALKILEGKRMRLFPGKVQNQLQQSLTSSVLLEQLNKQMNGPEVDHLQLTPSGIRLVAAPEASSDQE
jgi:hypothetical protein